jgi:TonB family protein
MKNMTGAIQRLQKIKLSFKCPKQLNELQPCNGDWYCDGCNKIVHDFRGMSEVQILGIISCGQHPCGIFEPNRIEVLPQQNKWLRWASAAMLALGLTSCYNMAIGQTEKPINIQKNATIDTAEIVAGGMVVIKQPEFEGGDDALRKYLYTNLKNPKGLYGKTIVAFTVRRDGSVTGIKIVSSSVPVFNAKVIRAVKQMPKWKPGLEGGQVIPIKYTLPINFSRASK